jgi:hypothetical protein
MGTVSCESMKRHGTTPTRKRGEWVQYKKAPCSIAAISTRTGALTIRYLDLIHHQPGHSIVVMPYELDK